MSSLQSGCNPVSLFDAARHGMHNAYYKIRASLPDMQYSCQLFHGAKKTGKPFDLPVPAYASPTYRQALQPREYRPKAPLRDST